MTLDHTGFIRIDPRHAPITPPGAAPTLTTVYADGNIPSEFASETTSPSNSLSKDCGGQKPTKTKGKSSKRKIRFSLPKGVKPAPARTVVDGTEGKKNRIQETADSLDIEGDLVPDGEDGDTSNLHSSAEAKDWAISMRKELPTTTANILERSQVDQLAMKSEWRRATVQDSRRMPAGKRRSVG